MSNPDQDPIFIILKPIDVLYEAGRFREALTALESLWRGIPEPQSGMKNSYLIVSYGVAIAKEVADLDLAWIWANRGLLYVGNHNLAGESELLVGDIAYRRGDKETAKTYFQLTFANSKSRLFRELDPRYLALGKKK